MHQLLRQTTTQFSMTLISEDFDAMKLITFGCHCFSLINRFCLFCFGFVFTCFVFVVRIVGAGGISFLMCIPVS